MHDVLTSQVGEYLLAIDASRVGSIADVDPETVESARSEFFDLSDLLGVLTPQGTRRVLEISGHLVDAKSGDREMVAALLLVGSKVRLEHFEPNDLADPPMFLNELWKTLCVQALVRGESAALLLDTEAMLARFMGRSGACV